MSNRLILLSLLSGLAAPTALGAETAAPPVLAPAPPPAPYSSPYALRSIFPSTTVRYETQIATYQDLNSHSATTVSETLNLSYRATSWFAPVVRLGLVSNWPPQGQNGTAFANPAIGGLFLVKLGSIFRLGFYTGMTLPVGTGSGNHPDPGVLLALKSASFGRSAMDASMFQTNELALIPGVDIAVVWGGLMFQLEATIFQLFRVRGEEVMKDQYRTYMTAGAHLAYFLIPQLSFGLEFRYQRWLSTPATVTADPSLRDTVSFALGLRGHFKISKSKNIWLRPAFTYARGISNPMNAMNYGIYQIDLPLCF